MNEYDTLVALAEAVTGAELNGPVTKKVERLFTYLMHGAFTDAEYAALCNLIDTAEGPCPF